MLLSIIVPVYKVEKYLDRCLKNLCTQLNEEVEVILVDDESPDTCPEICDLYSRMYSNVRVLHRKNGGAGAARNAGLDVAKGKFITFIDPDDCVSGNYYEMIKELASSNNELVAFSYTLEVNCGDKTTKTAFILPNACEDVAPAVLMLEQKASFNVLWNKIYTRAIIEEIPAIRFKERNEPGEDTIFNCEYFQRIKKVSLSEQNLYTYFRQGTIEESLSHKFWPDLYEKTICFITAKDSMYRKLNMISDEYVAEQSKQNVYYLFKCVPNMYRPTHRMLRTERLKFYNTILKSKDVQQWIEHDLSKDFLIRQFRFLYLLRSSCLMDLTYSMLFYIKYRVLPCMKQFIYKR